MASINAKTVIEAARLRHPLFTVQIISPQTALSLLTTVARRLLAVAQQLQNDYALAVVTVAVDVIDAHRTAGAGDAGGSPSQVFDGSTPWFPDDRVAGLAAEVGDAALTLADPERVVLAATATSLTVTGTPFGPANVGRLVRMKTGVAKGQIREVVSQTSNTLFLLASQPFAPIPEVGDVFDGRALVKQSGPSGLVTDLPTEDVRAVWVLKRSADGGSYIAYHEPLLCRFGIGVPLPDFHYIHVGSVHFRDATRPSEPLALVTSRERLSEARPFAAYVSSGALFLVGGRADWQLVRSLELRVAVPHPPITTDAGTLALRYEAEEAVKSALARQLALIAQRRGQDVDVASFQAEEQADLAAWTAAITGGPKVVRWIQGPSEGAPWR